MASDLGRFIDRPMHRRDFLKYAGFASAAGLLAACGNGEKAPGPGAQRPPIGQEPGTLQIFDWAGYEVKPLWRPYARQFPGDTPNWTTFKDDQFGFSKVAANPDAANFDIVHPCHYFWQNWVDLKTSDGSPVVQPWDTSLISNFGQINTAFIPSGRFQGKQYFIPADWGYAAPLYRTDKVEPKEDSWSLLWDDRYGGRITWWDSFDMFIPAAYFHGIEDPWNMTDAQLEEMKNFLISKKPLVKTLWSIDPVTEAMANGDVWIAYAWPLHYVELTGKKFPAVYMNPKEGRTAWYCGFALNNETKNYFHAHEYVDAWISAQSGQWLAENYAYGHLNTAIDVSKVDPEVVRVFSLDDPTALSEPKSHPEQNIPRRDVYQSFWDEVKAA
jgi:spermidine/putrescine transport system substrate-binding protein